MPTWNTSALHQSPPKFTSSGPTLVLVRPSDGALSVAPMEPLTFWAFMDGVTLNVTATLSGQTDVLERIETFAGRTLVQLVPRKGWTPGEVMAEVTVEDPDTLVTANAQWTFTAQPRMASYTGASPLDVERRLQQPMLHYLEVEPLRQFLLNNALAESTQALPRRGNVAARAVLQHAYATEISTVLNPYWQRDDTALATPVLERRRTYTLSEQLMGFKGRYEKAYLQLLDGTALPREFRNNFADYGESLLYHYRVSAAATLVLLACGVEATLSP